MWPGLSSLSLEVFRNCVQPYINFGDFPASSDGKASAYNVGDLGSIPG